MEIQNEFTVSAPIKETWEALLDVPGVALCLPGARLTGLDGDTYSGTVKVKVGPITTEYAGSARFVERDERDYRARIEAKGTETRGAGTASAMITTTLTDKGEHTVVSVLTDLLITGKVAQFGRGVIGDIAGSLLAQFSDNLEAKLQAPAAETTDVHPSVPEAAAPSLDILSLAGAPVLKRLAVPLGAVAAVGLIAYLLRRLRAR